MHVQYTTSTEYCLQKVTKLDTSLVLILKWNKFMFAYIIIYWDAIGHILEKKKKTIAQMFGSAKIKGKNLRHDHVLITVNISSIKRK